MAIGAVGTGVGNVPTSFGGAAFSASVNNLNRIAQATDCSDNNILSEIQKSKSLIRNIETLEHQLGLALGNMKNVIKGSETWKALSEIFLGLLKKLINLIPTVKKQLEIIEELLKCNLKPTNERVLNEGKKRLEQELADLEAAAAAQSGEKNSNGQSLDPKKLNTILKIINHKQIKTPAQLKNTPQAPNYSILPVLNNAGKAIGETLEPIGEAYKLLKVLWGN